MTAVAVKPLISLRGIGVRLGEHEPLSDVSFDLAPGECLGLVGESGSGKSLSCRVVTGLLPRIGGRAVRGSATFDGLDLLSLSEAEWRAVRGRRIALVPQASLSGLNPVQRIGRQLEETIRFLDPEADPAARARELLELVHMTNPDVVLRQFPHELSGGMRQRVMITLALAGRPEVIVADEPTTALDVTVERGILALLRELRRETGMSLILVSHDLGVVQSMADSIAVMYAGTVVERGPADLVLDRPSHPYTQALLAARPAAAAKGRRLAAIAGSPPAPRDRPSGCPFAPRCPHAREICVLGVPPLEEIEPSHATACARAEEIR